MVGNVIKKYGNNCLFAFGDYGQFNMKHQELTKGKGFRQLFIRQKIENNRDY